MRRSNLSYKALEQLLSQLLDLGFIVAKREERSVRYVVSDKGAEYLARYSQFESFAGAYGLRL